MLIIATQNSSKKEKIHLLKNESVSLPISFIVGICFISGSMVGSIFNFNLKKD